MALMIAFCHGRNLNGRPACMPLVIFKPSMKAMTAAARPFPVITGVRSPANRLRANASEAHFFLLSA
jgi:hypothetical protein